MTIYTAMPLELVFEGHGVEPGPFAETTINGMTVQLVPVAPGVGRIVRILSAPLDCYLKPEYSPGRLIGYFPAEKPISQPSSPYDAGGFGM